jgi:hypothetical protein
LQAIYRATTSDAAIAKERDWQYQHLLDLRKTKEKRVGKPTKPAER